MHQTIRFVIIAAAALGASLAHAGDLAVRVDGVDSAKGTVRVMLFDEANWPRQPIREGGVPAKKGSATVVLKDVAPGQYVYAAYHDDNGNGTLDMDQGKPTEKVAISRNPPIEGAPPSFDAAKVTLGEKGLSGRVKLDWIK